MKVGNNTGTNNVQTSDAPKTKGAGQAKKIERGSAPASTPKSSIPGAKTEISSKGKEFAQAREVAAKAPDTREDKIAELKQRIAGGSYKVDAKAVSDKLVDEHIKGM